MARLWTPIANAFEAYRRRTIVEPNAYYEHIWRLIHIHESLIVTLASAAATRLFYYWTEKPGTIEDEDSWKPQIQRLITGITSDDPSDPSKNDSRGCLKSGSVNEWINLLNVTTKVKLKIEEEDPFLSKLKEYLETIPKKQQDSQLAFLDDWSRIAPIPLNHKERGLSRIKRFQAINELRNKLAHVPISGRILPQLNKNLLQELLLLLTEDDSCLDAKTIEDSKTIQAIAKKWHIPLCGKIVNHCAYVEGSEFGASSKEVSIVNDVFWKWQQNNSSSQPLQWKASPFIHFDDELKVSLLFRLPNLTYELDALDGEYHRFAAEFEPVQKYNVSVNSIQPWLPSPITDKPLISGLESEPELGEQIRTQAENAFKSYDFENAVKHYETIANQYQSKYTDVAKSRHGAALWRVANDDKSNLTKEERQRKLREAIKLLDEATRHHDISYQAESFYQKSKALWHLSKIDEENNRSQDEQDAIEAIKTALNLSLEQRYSNWYEWLLDKIEPIDKSEISDVVE